MKTKSTEILIKEIVKKFADADIRYLYPRLTQRIGGDVSEALVYIQDNLPELNKLFTASMDANTVYSIVDTIEKSMMEEFRKARGSS